MKQQLLGPAPHPRVCGTCQKGHTWQGRHPAAGTTQPGLDRHGCPGQSRLGHTRSCAELGGPGEPAQGESGEAPVSPPTSQLLQGTPSAGSLRGRRQQGWLPAGLRGPAGPGYRQGRPRSQRRRGQAPRPVAMAPASPPPFALHRPAAAVNPAPAGDGQLPRSITAPRRPPG